MENITLVAIAPDMDITPFAEEPAKTNLEMTLAYYKQIGFAPQWISYLAKRGPDYVGLCAFKGVPRGGKVELAYHTFPAFEGRGIATAMCKYLIDIARRADGALTVTARTLPETNASTRVLEKNGFHLSGTVTDPEDGEVYEWVL